MSDDLLKEPLPEPWTFGVTQDGRVFFINDEDQTTTWLHPDTGQPAMTGYYKTIDLPSGWEQAFTGDGSIYYINHNEKTTTLQHPNAPEDQPSESTLKRKKRIPSFTGTLTRPLFRRSSSKTKNKTDVTPQKQRKPSISRKHSIGGSKGLKMTVMRRDPNARVARSGWLYKQDSTGMGNVKIWRKRWFVLCDFCLFYYKDVKEEEVLGSIVLPSYEVTTVNPDDKINRKYAFKIEHPGMRTYYISAESYNGMAEWVRELTPLCTFPSGESKSASRKSLGSKENVGSKPTDEDAEFGFNEPKRSFNSPEVNSDSSTPPSSKKERRAVVNGNNSNAKRSVSSSISTPSAQSPRQPYKNNYTGRTSSASSRTYSSTTPSSGVPSRRINSAPSSRHPDANRAMRYSNRNGDYFSDVSTTPENRRSAPPSNKVKRNDSMLKLGNWVQSQKQKQNSSHNLNAVRRVPNTYDTASEMSSTSSRNRKSDYNYPVSHRSPHRIPSSSKRYKPGSYNDYMDQTDVASSIMSVPPLYRTKVMTLPRPRSSQALDDKRSQKQRMANSKSVGQLITEQSKPAVRTKSETNLPHGVNRGPTQNYSNTLRSPGSPRRNYDDVFSPISNGYQDNKHFKYNSHYNHRTPSFNSAVSQSTPNSAYEVRQVDVNGRQGQLRAFAISAKQQSSAKPPEKNQNLSNGIEKLKLNESNDIEVKLKRLNELSRTLQSLTSEIQNLQQDKYRLEISLQKAKSSFTTGVGSEFELEEKLSKVKSQLAGSAQKLKAISKENEAFEKEIRKLKAKLLEDLNEKMESESNQRQLEWELGRVQLIMERVNKNKVGLVNEIQSVQDDNLGSDLSPPSSGRSNSSKKYTDYTLRSPRDVKRLSTERRTPGSATLYNRTPSSSSSVSQDNKYFTLPGHGVSRASSVDSLTAAQIARFTRPLSARSSNLQRTKSAAERLLAGSHGNISTGQDPNEIKRIQREINESRRRTLTGDFTRRYTAPKSYMRHDTHMKVGIDVQMAIKHHRMPKVLQRAKREMQRAEAERPPTKRDFEVGFDIDRFEAEAVDSEGLQPRYNDVDGGPVSPHKEEDIEPDELYVDLNLTHQLIAPDKVEIPDRLVDYEEIELSPEQERLKQKKIRAIESMLSRSGQTASQPTVHLAAALAAEAGTVARAVAYQAQQNKEIHPSIV